MEGSNFVFPTAFSTVPSIEGSFSIHRSAHQKSQAHTNYVRHHIAPVKGVAEDLLVECVLPPINAGNEVLYRFAVKPHPICSSSS